MATSTPFNYWANNIFAGFRHFISSLHFMSHFTFTLYSHTPLPPPHHPSPPQTTISTITATPQVAVLTLFFIFTSAPCSRRQLIPSRCLFLQAQRRGVSPFYTHHHQTTNTTSTTVRQSIHHHKHTTQQLSMHTMDTTNTIQTTLMTPSTIIQPTFHEFFLHSTKAYYTNINSHTETITPK
jgi:hypothetical protein